MSKQTGATPPKSKHQAITSLITPDKALFELLHDPLQNITQLAQWRNNDLQIESSFLPGTKEKIVPYSPGNPLLKHRIILFPSEVVEYGDEGKLIREVRDFVHRYVDVSGTFELIATYYILLSWVYDGFNELPYLRLCGDYGSGKTRFLQTVGSICYKPIFASGASTVAPLFHILNQIGGTLILDEGDFRFSDERTDIAKILNNGNAKGFPVLRCEKINQNEFSPKAYQVYGPKIITSRNNYEDLALESRFITEEVGWRKIRADIPVTLPESFHDEALALRNKLLMWRFRNFFKERFPEAYRDPKLDGRINQIFTPLLSLVSDAEERAQIIALARAKNEQLRSDRGFQIEADVLFAIRKGYERFDGPLAISDIMKVFIEKFGLSYENRVTPKWIGSFVRKKLRLSTRKRNGVYVLCENQKVKLERLYAKYDV